MTEHKTWSLLLVFCLGSRLLSAIYYIEDLDSLRFALGVLDYDVTKLQPHFPAYPVFCFFSKGIYALTASYALAFSLVGGLSIFCIVYFTLQIIQTKNTTPLGIATILVLFFNPLLWLMSNRYMPDTMGVACIMAVFYFTLRPESTKIGLGFFVAGLSIGVRLSYAPFLLAPLMVRLISRGPRLGYVGAGAVGVGIWLVPLILLTGWNELLEAAQTHTQSHFVDFGGTIATEPDLNLRFIRLFESIWADGFGLYWPGRHVATLCTTIALVSIIAAKWRSLKTSPNHSAFFHLALVGCLLYLGWIFFFQNVVHKSRHVLPLLPFLALIPAYACAQLANRSHRSFQLVLIVFGLCYGSVTLHLVAQHKKPTAVAQVHRYLAAQQNDTIHIASVPLIKSFLKAQGLQAVYIPIKDQRDWQALGDLNSTAELVSIGSPLKNRPPKATKTFYHNPYVNRMWSELSLYEY